MFYQPAISEGSLFLDQEESRHCVRVLRKTSGDTIRVADGKGYFYEVVITKADQNKCLFEIQHQFQQEHRPYSIHVAISPTKNADRIEWFVEKCVEIGIDCITLMDCKNTERSFIKKDRLHKMAVSAMKQSLKASLPLINDVTPFPQVIGNAQEEMKFIAFVDQSNPDHLKDLVLPNRSYMVLIGPEGDFTKEELDIALRSDFKKVSLGSSRLRTETAGIAACHILNLIQS
nr:16S rRNA (uracil(1498)-N(3))-methyltransferase [Chryseosolibacter indicus]